MIEEIILNYLRENGFPCFMSVPENPSGNFCVLEKTGSDCDEGIYTATLAVQSYGHNACDHDGTLGAAQLNEQIKAAMQAADTLPEVVSCRPCHRLQFPGHHPQTAPLSGRFFYHSLLTCERRTTHGRRNQSNRRQAQSGRCHLACPAGHPAAHRRQDRTGQGF
ncbi:MAG: hypothetical protein V8R95_10645 [Faecalibacterium sp.]